MSGTRTKKLRRLFKELAGVSSKSPDNRIMGLVRTISWIKEGISGGATLYRKTFGSQKAVAVNQFRRFKRAVGTGENPRDWVAKVLPGLQA